MKTVTPLVVAVFACACSSSSGGASPGAPLGGEANAGASSAGGAAGYAGRGGSSDLGGSGPGGNSSDEGGGSAGGAAGGDPNGGGNGGGGQVGGDPGGGQAGASACPSATLDDLAGLNHCSSDPGVVSCALVREDHCQDAMPTCGFTVVGTCANGQASDLYFVLCDCGGDLASCKASGNSFSGCN